ncbi:TPA: hypothetical protein QEM49_004889 [Pseudomonas putida]|uniref:hypothetical protein n=1 Tax=Pseudomonas putida TaxID=303 RepID=UPI002363339D|nr:hypothetical protein [Pseudomonas putida]MDD2012859.1 hypothetical protein [Pseudomonas putida]HDS1780308.1 hypothetical protein [Pseudomonas putida]
MMLSSKLQRALVFLSDLDAEQHLVDAWSIGDVVIFRVAAGHQIYLQRSDLVMLAALLQRPVREIKAVLRTAAQPAPGPDLATRLQRYREEARRKQRLLALLQAPP